MRLLLDTHALLWWWTDDPRLSPHAREAISTPENQVFVSAASAWEIAIKHQLGKLSHVPEITRRFPDLIAADGFSPLAITHLHALRAGAWLQSHRDPFDRMLAAQAAEERVPLVTSDPALTAFGIELLW